MRENKTNRSMKYIEEDYLSSIGCNKCGKLVEFKRGTERDVVNFNSQQFQSFQCSFEYGSKHDGERWNFELCDDCLLDIIRSFEVVPSGFMQHRMASQDPQGMFEHWKKTGKIDHTIGLSEEEKNTFLSIYNYEQDEL